MTPDGISSRLLQGLCRPALSGGLLHIFNLSLSLERVPVLWKTSCVGSSPQNFAPQGGAQPLQTRGLNVSPDEGTGEDRPQAPPPPVLSTRSIPSLLRVKLERAEASDQLAAWVTNYLTDRPQFVRLQDCVSDVVVCSTGPPQGTRGTNCEYRKVIMDMDFVDWCELNHLQINASKTKEMVVDFSRKPSSEIALVNIQGLDIERGLSLH
ncbi:hypothetical protein L3Q82_012090 [Scortum barcoo]|uniref:Uncharacterized protein n=1 Tax=Scortum barcoo TaxID=214431 RepID=A0ACB8W6X9_9TELE|nr:hypothetical protein L3Q82_012090 [Scortum barcoo]